MGDIVDIKKGARVVPLIEQRNEVGLVDPKSVQIACTIIHPQGVDKFSEFIIAGYNEGVMTTVAFMDLPDMAVAVSKLQDLFEEAMAKVPPEQRMHIASEIAKRMSK